MDEIIEFLPLRQLNKKAEYADRDDEIVDYWIGFRPGTIPNRYHTVRSLPKPEDRVNGDGAPSRCATPHRIYPVLSSP